MMSDMQINIQKNIQKNMRSKLLNAHTQASFTNMWYKDRDPALGIGRKLSIIRPGATTIVAL